MPNLRVLMLVGDFVEDYEAMVPLQILQTLGVTVDVACPDKKVGDTVATAIHDFEGEQTYSEKRGHNFAVTIDWNAIDESQYDGLVLPGGRAPEYLQLNERVLEIVRYFATNDLPLAATCHAGYLLAAADVVQGKECQAYPTLRPELQRAGAKWIEPSAGLDSVHTDGNLITAPAWPANAVWMRQFSKALGIALP